MVTLSILLVPNFSTSFNILKFPVNLPVQHINNVSYAVQHVLNSVYLSLFIAHQCIHTGVLL